MKLTILVLSLSVALSICRADFDSLNVLRPGASPAVQASTVWAMVHRVVGPRAAEFTIVIQPSLTLQGADAFKIQATMGQVEITGTTGVAASMGVYYYLKQYCGSMFTWAGENINLPSPLPTIKEPVVVNVLDRFRYYQNVCTVSYSSAFWDWTRWERHLDWMALNGINLPLAFTGQEAIFQRLFMNMGFNQTDLDDFFGGPAFLAWSRMGNIQGWGGPLSQTWITKKLLLQHQILKRMRAFGMIPVLPAFAGHVPRQFTQMFPNANVTRLGGWSNFNQTYSYTYLLDFNDPMFETIGAEFIKLLESEFGVDHIYNADTFNEMAPKSSAPEYLAAAGKAVYSGMQKADPDAVWLMQGWMFRDSGFWGLPQTKALLTSVPMGRMIVLDLISELDPLFVRLDSYFGQPFIWCMLHNFGGTMELYGAIDNVNVGPSQARSIPSISMVGIGLTMEGIFQNEVMYEFMMENAWRVSPRNITSWISTYTQQRYNFTSPEIDRAWQLLKGSVYNCTNGHNDNDHVLLTRRPNLNQDPRSDLWYNPEMLYQAWDNLLLGADQFKPNELYLYDLVDVTRNSLQDLSLLYYTLITQAFTANNTAALQAAGKQMTDLLRDLETLTASDPHFLLGSWTHQARSYATDPFEAALLEYNARNQVTIWGPRGEIVDYAAKQWSGLFKDYYVPRWQFFVDYLVQVVQNGTKFDSYIFNRDILEKVEIPFNLGSYQYPTNPTGDSVAIAKALHKKYRKQTTGEFFRQMSANAQQTHLSNKKLSPFSWQQAESNDLPIPDVSEKIQFQEVKGDFGLRKKFRQQL